MEAFLAWAPLISIALNFLIVPLILILWRLNESVHALRLHLTENYVTGDDLNERMELERAVWHNRVPPYVFGAKQQ